MDPQQATYDGAGRLVCRTCTSAAVVASANQTIELRDPTSTRNLYMGAASSVLIGVATCCFAGAGRLFFLAAPGAIFTGGWTIFYLLRHPETKAQLGGGWWLVLVMSAVGALFGLLAIAVGILWMVGAGMTAADGY